MFGVKKFHQYVYGTRFILETDHKPLTFIFGPKRGLPQMAASRIQRWTVFLSGYDMEIRHIRGVDNGHADSLSRVPLPWICQGQKDGIEDASYLNCI